MMNNPFYTSANHGEFEYLELGDFALDGGGVIRDAKLAYAAAAASSWWWSTTSG